MAKRTKVLASQLPLIWPKSLKIQPFSGSRSFVFFSQLAKSGPKLYKSTPKLDKTASVLSNPGDVLNKTAVNLDNFVSVLNETVTVSFKIGAVLSNFG